MKFGIDSKFTEVFNVAWILGITSVISNSVYVILDNKDKEFLWWIGFFGLIWFVPFFIEFDSFYGIPSLVLYFLLVIYIHRETFIRKKTV